jgi:hypothetical protein
MGALSSKLRNVAGGGLTFWCAGCREAHTVWVGEGPGPRWTWNGDVERPVFGPSVLVRGVKRLTDERHAAWMRGEPLPEPVPQICHTFVGCNGAQPGEIVYLSDCTHELAGKVIPLPDMPSYRGSEA